MTELQVYQSVGRRKTSVAQVRLLSGNGKIMVNKKPAEKYFYSRRLMLGQLKVPLKITKRIDRYNIFVNVKGGGVSSQLEATRLGIARTLAKAEPSLKPSLRKAGLLTRDARMVERKKSGQPKAHKRFQFSKR